MKRKKLNSLISFSLIRQDPCSSKRTCDGASSREAGQGRERRRSKSSLWTWLSCEMCQLMLCSSASVSQRFRHFNPFICTKWKMNVAELHILSFFSQSAWKLNSFSILEQNAIADLMPSKFSGLKKNHDFSKEPITSRPEYCNNHL